jgi:hypothetical protein
LSHPTVGDMTVLAPPVRLDGDGFRPATATAAFGSETDALLDELGFTPEIIDALVGGGVTHRGRDAGG